MRNMKRYKTLEITDTLLKNLTIAKPLGKIILLKYYSIDVNTDRYENLYKHGLKCAKCGREATFAAIERQKGVRRQVSCKLLCC